MRVTSKMSLFAAGVVAALWIATPAVAAEIVPPGKQAAGIASVKTASAPTRRHHIWPRYRVASWYTSRLHYADATPFFWHSYFSSRPVPLMIGIAY
jgi:hypothetical protein